MNSARRTATAGLTVNLRVEGSGPPLLFLGGSTFDLSLKAAVFESALSEHFTVAAADPRGLGQTDQPDGKWSMEDYAKDALLIMDALGWTKAHVLGESFGAMVALNLSRIAPERVHRMALAAVSPGGGGGSSYPVERFLEVADPRARASAALGILDSRFARLVVDTPEAAEDRLRDRIVGDVAFMASHQNFSGYPRLLSARSGHDSWRHLPGIDVPTLVFAGRYDMQAPLQRAERIVGAMPCASLIVVEGGHGHCFSTPEPVATIIERWARRTGR